MKPRRGAPLPPPKRCRAPLIGAAPREPGELDAPELRDAVCACLHDLLPTMKPEHADVVRAVDLEERPIADVAAGGASP